MSKMEKMKKSKVLSRGGDVPHKQEISDIEGEEDENEEKMIRENQNKNRERDRENETIMINKSKKKQELKGEGSNKSSQRGGCWRLCLERLVDC